MTEFGNEKECQKVGGGRREETRNGEIFLRCFYVKKIDARKLATLH